MAKKRKFEKKMVAKLPETDNLDPDFKLSENTIQNLLKSKYIQLLILITVIGAFLRFYNLGFNSLWLDEASTLTYITQGSLLDIWKFTIIVNEPNPPLFHWLEYISISLFGENSEFILRFIPALAGTLAIPVMYFIGKEFIDENGGLIAASACAIFPFLVLYSQEARAYSLFLLFIALGTLFYLKALETPGYKYWILFAIASSLAFWTHFYTVIFLTALMIYTLVIYKMKYIKELLMSYGILGIAIIPLGVISLPLLLKRTNSNPTFGVQGLNVIIETLIQLTGYNIIITYILILLFICGITTLYIKDKNKSIFILWLLVFTFAASILLSFKIPMVPRYLIFLEIPLILGIAYSYKLFYSITKQKAITYMLIIGLVGLNIPFLMSYYSGYSKDDWRGFSQTLYSTTQPGDSIIIVPGYMYQPLNYYYSNTTDETIEYLASNETELESARALQTKYSYYIVTGDIMSANPNGDALRWIQNNTQQVYQSNNIFVFKS